MRVCCLAPFGKSKKTTRVYAVQQAKSEDYLAPSYQRRPNRNARTESKAITAPRRKACEYS
jgi:hypothetical protein